MIAGNKNKKPKLYNSFLLSFLAAAFLPLILAGVLLYWPLTSELRNNAESNSQKIATSVRTMIYQFMGEYDAVIKTIERFQDTAALDDAEMETVLSGFLSTYPAIRAIEFADKSGKIVFSIPASNHLVGTDISRQGYYSLYSQFTSTIWSDIVIPQNQSTPLIIAAKKTKSGGILISLSISNLSGMVQELGGGKEYLIFITDSRGNLVLHPDIEQVLKQQNYKDLKSVQDAMRGKEGFRQERIDSEDFAVSTKLIGSANWVIVAGSPVTFAYKSLFVFYQTYVISFLAAFIIASVISILRFRKFSASLVALDKATGQFADPNGSVELDPKEYEEIDKVYRSFSKMFAELRKREDDLTAVNAALSVSVHEKEVLLAEVHHRVKNNLTVILGLLNLKMDENKDSAFRETINEIKAKIYGIAHVHEQMYYTGNFSSLAFGGYIQSLATEAARLFSGNRNIDLIFNVEEVLITVNQAVPCGLIFLEILTNAYKHAFKDRSNGKITISLTGGDKVILVISDDGVGIAKDSANTRRMGMTIIKALVEQLAGEWDMSGACGVRHRIEFVPQL